MTRRLRLIVALLLLTSGACFAQNARHVVMVMAPAVSISDLSNIVGRSPSLKTMLERGAVGLLNTRTAGRTDTADVDSGEPAWASESSYATLGAGARAALGEDGREGFDADEVVAGLGLRASDVLRQRTLASGGRAEVVHTGLARMQRDCTGLGYDITLGQMGESLHAAGLRTAVMGNSDGPSIHRESVTVCMDAVGRVDYGDVSADVLRRDPGAPYGVTMDIARLSKSLDRAMASAALVVIEPGDTARVERMRFDMSDDRFQAERRLALKRAMRALDLALARADLRDTVVVLVAPYPPSHIMEASGNSLCPIVAVGAGIEHGLLCSGSTRTQGVVTNADVLPSVLGWLGVPSPPALVGRAMTTLPSREPLREVGALYDRISLQTMNLQALRQSASVLIVLVLFCALALIVVPRRHPARLSVLRVIALAPAALAPAMLLLALIPFSSLVFTWFALVGLMVVLVGGALLGTRRPAQALLAVSAVFAVVACWDLFTHGTMCRYSIMAYSIAEGARYYGVGNEFMGALIGAGIVGVCLALHLTGGRPWIGYAAIAGGLLVFTAAIGAPTVGANMGGAIASITGFGVCLAAFRGKRIGFKTIAVVFGCVVAALAVFALIDSRVGQGGQSHLGRALALAQSSGIGGIGDIIERKVAMNVTLVRSIWSRLLLAYVVSGAVCVYATDLRARLRALPISMRAAFIGVIAGSIAALVFNDSGMVAAATCLGYGWSLLACVALDPAFAAPERTDTVAGEGSR